jgi:hypothetical protein
MSVIGIKDYYYETIIFKKIVNLIPLQVLNKMSNKNLHGKFKTGSFEGNK